MQIILDTSSLVRFFTNDIPEKAEKVEKLFDEESLVIPDVVFPELEYILGRGYTSTRNEIVKTYHFLLAKRNIKISPYVRKAVTIFEQSNLDMADCIIAVNSLKGALASFDKKLLKVEKVKSFWN